MKFFQKKREETTKLVIVVTSYAATGAVVRTYDREGSVTHPVVLFTHTETIHARHGRDQGLLNELTAAAVKRTAELCRKFHAADEHTSGNFDDIVCVIGEPWILTTVRTAHSEKPAPFAVTKKIVDEMISRDRKLFEAEALNRFADDEVGLVQVSKPLLDLNGYRVQDYVGQRAKTIDMHIAYSITDAGFMDELAGAFVDVFHSPNVTFKSLDISRAVVADPAQDEMVIELGGSTSVIAIINRGIPTRQVVIPMGLTDIADHISKLFDVPANRISSVMHFATDEKLLQHERDEYYRRIELAFKPLGILMERACVELRRELGQLPEKGYMAAIPTWADTLRPLVSKYANAFVDEYVVSDIVYAHGTIENEILSIAIKGLG